ncbi:MAG: histidine--tRNA ligase [Planctomycetota bacterium]
MSAKVRIEPRTLRGFRDYLPAAALARERLIDTAKAVYKGFGFAPIDTPALEYTEILLGKGGDETDKQLYRFTDNGGRDVALRFDLTIPFARFAAQHTNDLGLPFKRYHVGSVWRGENTQRGRYREFIQCDFDTIGTESPLADQETALVIHELFQRLGFERFTIRVNDRRVLNGLLERLELSERSVAVLRALDKLAKIGPEKVAEELTREAGASAAQAAGVLEFAALTGKNEELLARLAPLVQGTAAGEAGIASLAGLLAGAGAAGVDAARIALDVSIARGLDYYTGAIFETFLDDLPGIGSVCSGGRYDDLASLYTKQRLPGVGASLGVDRLLAAMEELKMVDEKGASCPILVTCFDAASGPDALALASELRGAGLGVELYPDPKKLGDQLKYAARRGFALVVIAGPAEREAGNVQVKLLATSEAHVVARGDVAQACARLLAV